MFGTLIAKWTSDLYYNSGFEIQQAIFPIGIYIFQFYIEFTFICTLYLLIARLWVCWKLQSLHSKVSNYLGFLALYAFPFRYHIEVLLKLYISVAIEINYMSGWAKRNLSNSGTQIFFLILSILLLLFLTLLLLILIILAI